MLWVFDEIRDRRNPMLLIADSAGSLFRQWFIGYGLWKAAIAIILALLPILSLFQGMARHKQRWLRGVDRHSIQGPAYSPAAQTTFDVRLARPADRH
jgi:hypothetical protein